MTSVAAVSCADVLSGRAPKDAPVTVRGWVRTRRDSKAGLSFVHVSDGSCFDPIQVVAPNTLPNYADEVLKLTAGCAVEATGSIVPSQGKGQAFEMQADDDRGRRLGRRPRHLPDPAQAAHARVPARGRAPAAAHQHVRRGHARAPHARAGDPPLLPRARLLLGPHADHHRLATPRAPAQMFRVSTLDLANLPRTPRRQGRLRARTSSASEAFLTVSGQLNVETYCLALSQGLHVRPDVPRRELATPAATSPSSG